MPGGRGAVDGGGLDRGVAAEGRGGAAQGPDGGSTPGGGKEEQRGEDVSLSRNRQIRRDYDLSRSISLCFFHA